MELKIGISDSPRELVIATAQTPAEVESAVSEALTGGAGAVLSLADDKGRRYLISAAKIAYIEIGLPTPARVGFGSR